MGTTLRLAAAGWEATVVNDQGIREWERASHEFGGERDCSEQQSTERLQDSCNRRANVTISEGERHGFHFERSHEQCSRSTTARGKGAGSQGRRSVPARQDTRGERGFKLKADGND